LLEPVKLDQARISLQNFDFVALGGSTPMRPADVALVECKGFTAAGWLPAQTILGESAFPILLGQVQVNVIEALPVNNCQLSL
jgi:hypothetical protein